MRQAASRLYWHNVSRFRACLAVLCLQQSPWPTSLLNTPAHSWITYPVLPTSQAVHCEQRP